MSINYLKNMQTIKINKVELNDKYPLNNDISSLVTHKLAIESLLGNNPFDFFMSMEDEGHKKYLKDFKIESFSEVKEPIIIAISNPFLEAIENAWNNHYNLVITPDIIWLLLIQGLSLHINTNSKKYKHLFTNSDKKTEIHIDRSNFIKGNKNNNWPDCFTDFVNGVKNKFKREVIDIFTQKFSTTNAIEQAAFEITLLDAVKSYANLYLHTLCGIPEIIIEGSKEDYEKIYNEFQKFKEFDLDWWVEELNPVLNEFINVFNDNVNIDFWDSIFSNRKASGENSISGWCIKFFPYIYKTKNKTTKNQFRKIEKGEAGQGINIVPFKWLYLAETFDMEFLAGFTCNIFDDKLKAIKPNIGWCVKEKTQ